MAQKRGGIVAAPDKELSVLYPRRINKVENEYLKYPPWVDLKKMATTVPWKVC